MTILKHRIDTLRLRADAPFPSQAEDAQDAIRQWRHEQLVRRLDSGNGSSDPDYCDDLDLQGEIE
jgi:hypothetical protein